MRKLSVFLGVVFMTIGSAVSAQEVDSMAPMQMSSWGDATQSEIIDYIPDVLLDMRTSYSHDLAEGAGAFGATGLYLDINGYLTPSLSYSINHILCASYFDSMPTGFGATQWLNLTYETGDFSITAGKLSLNVGSYEYDADVLDQYFDMCSGFYNMFDCYQWGMAAGWDPSESHSFSLQIVNSPLATAATQFGYNLGWRGECGWYKPYWTINLWQYDKGRYMTGLNFANRLTFGGFSCDLEYMARAAGVKGMFKDDFNVIALPSYRIGEWFRVFGKCGWEHTTADLPYDLTYEETKGSDFIYYGAGVEFFPFKEDRDVRIHAIWTSNNFGMNLLDIGVRWKMDMTKTVKSILSRNRQ